MKVFINQSAYRQDITNLIKSFYPNEAVQTDENPDISINMKKTYAEIIFFGKKYEVFDDVVLRDDYGYKQKSLSVLIKRKIYELISNKESIKLPWGILTGVRPSKLYRMLRNKFSERTVSNILSTYYRLSNDKINELSLIYENQKQALKYKGEDIIYIGIPFCPSKCTYCTFTTLPSKENLESDYVDALIADIYSMANAIEQSKIIYIGGGTPTALNDDNFERLLKVVGDFRPFVEFTLEAGRVDTINDNKLKTMKKYGVTRISINPQTFSDDTLSKINRTHSVKDIVDKYKKALEYGFDDINMDVIIGLPDENIEHIKNTVTNLINLRPTSITVHSLALKRKSELSAEKGKSLLNKTDELSLMYDYAVKELVSADYKRYYIYRQKNIAGNRENVGLTLEGYMSIYNILMMEDIASVISFGTGAVSKLVTPDKIARVMFPKDTKTYISTISSLIAKRKELFSQKNSMAWGSH